MNVLISLYNQSDHSDETETLNEIKFENIDNNFELVRVKIINKISNKYMSLVVPIDEIRSAIRKYVTK